LYHVLQFVEIARKLISLKDRIDVIFMIQNFAKQFMCY